jgi:4'-phosphopantetheinyl transferase
LTVNIKYEGIIAKKVNFMWQEIPNQLQLNNNTVHLWLIDCQDYLAQIPDLIDILSSEEREKAARFKFALHRERFIINRANLKIILGKYLQISPNQVIFEYGDKGKPNLAHSLNFVKLNFNLSHSENLAIYGISQHLIGVDLEKINEQVSCAELAERFFCPSEFKAISTLSYPENYRAFYLAWTSKEAYLKAIGAGLAGGLDSLELDLNVPENVAKIINIKGKEEEINHWQLHNFTIENNFIFTVVIANNCPTEFNYYSRKGKFKLVP